MSEEHKKQDDGGDVDLKPRSTNKVDPPRMYQVIFHNDDYTTQTLVEDILKTIFHKSPAEAETLTMIVHTKGSAVVAIMTKDLAETKTEQAITYARSKSAPLMITTEPQ